MLLKIIIFKKALKNSKDTLKPLHNNHIRPENVKPTIQSSTQKVPSLASAAL